MQLTPYACCQGLSDDLSVKPLKAHDAHGNVRCTIKEVDPFQ